MPSSAWIKDSDEAKAHWTDTSCERPTLLTSKRIGLSTGTDETILMQTITLGVVLVDSEYRQKPQQVDYKMGI